MPSIIEDLSSVVLGVIEGATHNALAIVIVLFLAYIAWLWWGKPKPVNLAQEIFKKQWGATVDTLGLENPKTIGLCSYPLSIQELRSMPMHQIHYRNIGKVVGINMTGIRTSVKKVVELSKEGVTTESLKKFMEDNKDTIDQDKFWVMFAIERNVGGFFLFPKIRKTLLFAKESQIINIDSHDDIIRLRGFGVHPQGEYELVVDKDFVINSTQLNLDTAHITFDETTLGTLARMGQFVEKAIDLDSKFKKDVAVEGIKTLAAPQGQEVKS